MRIALIASNFISLPPQIRDLPRGFSGAAEWMAWILSEELVKRGHEVTLYASGDSHTRACLQSVTQKATSLEKKPAEFYLDYEHLLVSQAYADAKDGRYDILHSHLTSRSAFYAPLVKVPTVVTIHSPLTGQAARILQKRPDTQHYVSISDAQRIPLPDLNYTATIYHGINVEDFPYRVIPDEYFLFAGRIVPEKGVVETIETAAATNTKIVILGLVDDEESTYYREEVEPLLKKYATLVTLKGKTDREELRRIVSCAKGLIFPIKWEEPFGLVMVEAMACGTPVVAYDRGSVSEIIEDGVTGYIVNPPEEDVRIENSSASRPIRMQKSKEWIIKKSGVEGLVEAVERLQSMPKDDYRKIRENCRKRVEENFTVERMVDGYENVYRKILSH